MEVPAARLKSALEGTDVRCFFVHGAETLLVDEARATIRAHLAARGYGDVSRFTAEAGFDYSALTRSSRSLSLFPERRTIELRLVGDSPGEKGEEFINDFLASPGDDTALVILCGRLDKKSLGKSWYKALARDALVVDTGTVSAAALPRWIRQRFADLGASCTDDAAARLAYFVEGNLLAADQEVRKLALMVPPGGTLDERRLEEVMADHARFTVFALVDACVAGQGARAVRILRSLRAGGTEPVVLVWALAREVRTLGLVGAALKAGRPRAEVMSSQRIWSSRVPLVMAALKRLGLSRLGAVHRRVAYLDRRVKGQERHADGPDDPWVEIERVALALCGIKSVQ